MTEAGKAIRYRLVIGGLTLVVCFGSWVQLRLFTTLRAVNAQLAELRTGKRTGAPAGKPSPSRDVGSLPLIDVAGDPVKGDKRAPLAMVEYSDFECPYCARFTRETLPLLEREYVTTGKILMFFKQQPLPIHRDAMKAAEYAICSGTQGKFWEMHNRLFQEPKRLDEPSLRSNARAVGLNLQALDVCLQGPAAEKVRLDQASAATVGATGTPAFFIGRLTPDSKLKIARRVSGAAPADQFRTAIDQALAQVASASK